MKFVRDATELHRIKDVGMSREHARPANLYTGVFLPYGVQVWEPAF